VKYLILGSGSFAGQSYFHELLVKNIDVYGINRSYPKPTCMWPWTEKCDLSNRWFTANLVNDLPLIIDILDQIKPDIILDFMGQGMVAPSWEDPALWFHTNITQKSKILRHLTKSAYLKQYVRASTPEVYGSNSFPQKPNAPFNPTTPYAVSHSSIDSYIRCLGRSFDFPFKIGRFANFYGVGQQLYRVIPRLILCCMTGTRFMLDGGGTSLRSFIYASDISSAIDLMINKGSLRSEYHFSGNEEISINELVGKICRLCEVEREEIVTVGPERLGKDLCYRLECTESYNELGWHSLVSLDEGISKMIKWISSNLDTLSGFDWTYQHKE